MKKYLVLTLVFLGFPALPLALHAQDAVEEQETMATVEGEAGSLSLPDEASAEGKEHSIYGLETANEARNGGREFGQARADSARQNRGDAGRETAADARRSARPQ